MLALALGLATGASSAAGAPVDRTVVLMLFDGFAPAVVDRFETPQLDRMGREGVFTHRFEPAFPTISLINGVTISTGCWPENHGIVTNVFLDPLRGRYDHDADADWLTGCEHLHQAAERQGLRSAALSWVGARSASRGPQASIVGPDEEPCTELIEPRDLARADEVVRLLRLPAAERPRLVLAYFCGPDGAEHFTGMESAETQRAVEQSDAIVGRVLEAIDRLGERGRITLLVTTDHGMREVSHIVNIRRILLAHGVEAEAVSTGTTSFVYLKDRSRLAEALRKLAAYSEFELLEKGRLPAWARLGAGPRVPDLIVSAHPPYFIEDTERWPSWLQWLGSYGPQFLWARFSLKASHGYPPGTPGIEGILYAWGSGIRAGRELAHARAIDVHPTVAHLLGMEPGRPVDGHVVRELLADGVAGGDVPAAN
jgi:predicted AlkP superfamily pyrophosphatase or phosphodiesterase